ncbi:MAG: choice-of-anchor J domain-containing protein [Bacteroidetes bacterium]|nr:choice-of-anchor J domain-containing protein [Bacteroidota bacterium]MBS1929760.1 choice-of-anchor J domain-containing protein [Bacteroidota bacterium]
MKKDFLFIISGLAGLIFGTINGCKKDSSITPTHIGTTTSFIEEFEDVHGIQSRGWLLKDNTKISSSGPFASWDQGGASFDKDGAFYGFTAYSYNAWPGEFIYSSISAINNHSSISSWLISPVLSVKNGDKISFYARGDTTAAFTDRMQVLMNKSSSSNVGNTLASTGDFKTVLFDINPSQAPGGFPTAWTKFEYTFTGISGNIDTRIAFRHYANNPANARGIGIDQFRFQVN